jgi:hypothetical protein
MRLFTRGLSMALLGSCLLGISGCGEDNQSEINQQASKTSGTQVELKTPPPQTQQEFGERSKATQLTTPGAAKAAGYPGRR